MRAEQVRGDEHLIVESEDRVVEVDSMEAEMDVDEPVELSEPLQRDADSARQGSAELLQVVAFAHVLAIGICDSDADAGAVGGGLPDRRCDLRRV